MITTLTKEQEAMIPIIRDQWMNLIFNTRLDREKAKKGIDWLYTYCGKEKPVIIFMDSPFGCQVAANYFIRMTGKVPQGPANIWANIGANIRDNIWDNIGDNIGDNIWDNIRANIGDNIGANIRDNIGDMEYYATAWRGTPNDYGWVAFLDYFLQLQLIHSDKEAEFNQWKELLLAGSFEMIQFEGICFVSDMPTMINRDDNNQLHSLEGMSVQFKDEWGQYYIHGRNIPEHLFNAVKDKTITTEQFFKEGNEEVKSACIAMMQELHGDEFIVRFFEKDLKEINTYVDKKEEQYLIGTTGGMNVGVYTLFKGRINDEPVAFVRCFCPSTDRLFFLGVDPTHTNAKDSIASLYRVPRKLAHQIKYINRQGERFSTVFNESGTKLLKDGRLSKEDIQDTVTISGDRYFSLMQYEY